MNMTMIPEHMRHAVKNYLDYGLEPGDFLQAVLENNLVRAFGLADYINLANMQHWAEFLYNEMPSDAWGSREKVETWMKARREEDYLKSLAEKKEDNHERISSQG